MEHSTVQKSDCRDSNLTFLSCLLALKSFLRKSQSQKAGETEMLFFSFFWFNLPQAREKLVIQKRQAWDVKTVQVSFGHRTRMPLSGCALPQLSHGHMHCLRLAFSVFGSSSQPEFFFWRFRFAVLQNRTRETFKQVFWISHSTFLTHGHWFNVKWLATDWHHTLVISLRLYVHSSRDQITGTSMFGASIVFPLST